MPGTSLIEEIARNRSSIANAVPKSHTTIADIVRKTDALAHFVQETAAVRFQVFIGSIVNDNNYVFKEGVVDPYLMIKRIVWLGFLV